MSFNLYLKDETGQQRNKWAKRAGESRNALVRLTVGDWLSNMTNPSGLMRCLSGLQVEDWRCARFER